MCPKPPILKILGIAGAVWTAACLHGAPAGPSGVLTLDRLVGERSRQGVTVANFNTSTYNNPNEREHVVCQEVAHTFGLDHQSTSGSSLNTCMDYFSNTGANATNTASTRPNAHDFEELNIIYADLDTTTTVAALTSPAASASDVTDDPNSWGQIMSQSPEGRSSTYETVNRDGSRTITHVYWTREAAADCPSCDHRIGR